MHFPAQMKEQTTFHSHLSPSKSKQEAQQAKLPFPNSYGRNPPMHDFSSLTLHSIAQRVVDWYVTTRHDNGAGRRRVLSPKSSTSTLQHVLIPVLDTQRVKIYYLILVPVGYWVSPTPSRTQFKLEK